MFILVGTFFTILIAYPLKIVSEKLINLPYIVGIFIFITGCILYISEFKSCWLIDRIIVEHERPYGNRFIFSLCFLRITDKLDCEPHGTYQITFSTAVFPIYGNGRKIFFSSKGQKIFSCIMQTCGFHVHLFGLALFQEAEAVMDECGAALWDRFTIYSGLAFGYDARKQGEEARKYAELAYGIYTADGTVNSILGI